MPFVVFVAVVKSLVAAAAVAVINEIGSPLGVIESTFFKVSGQKQQQLAEPYRRHSTSLFGEIRVLLEQCTTEMIRPFIIK